MTQKFLSGLVGFFLVSAHLSAIAADLPLWEIAVGAGVLQIPEYRGSDDKRTVPFPFVLPLYRGKRLRIDDEGIRGVLYDTTRVDLDFSIDANPDVDSDDSNAREGMPDLDPTLHLGPSLEVRLWTDIASRRALNLNLPLRAVFEVDFSNIDHVGFTGSPHLTFYKGLDLFGREWRLGLSGGLEFGTEKLHDFYYGVDPEFVTPTRREFDAKGGYAGTRFVGTFVSRSEGSWISLFVRYDRFDGAIFEDSPLVERSDGLTFGFIYSRFLARSKRRVQVDW